MSSVYPRWMHIYLRDLGSVSLVIYICKSLNYLFTYGTDNKSVLKYTYCLCYQCTVNSHEHHGIILTYIAYSSAVNESQCYYMTCWTCTVGLREADQGKKNTGIHITYRGCYDYGGPSSKPEALGNRLLCLGLCRHKIRLFFLPHDIHAIISILA